jgi:tetratricopeptide (TPR) repeat protein
MKKIFVMLLCIWSAASVAQTAAEYAKNAEQLLEKDDAKGALKLINKAIEMEPKDPRNYSIRGNVQVNLHNVKEAFADYDKSLRMDPKDPWLYLNRAIAFYTIQEPDQAIMDYDDALKLVPAGQDTIKYVLTNNRGNAKSMMRDFKGAYEDYKSVLAYDPRNIGALTNIASVCDEIGKGDETIGYLLEVIEIDPTFVGGYGNLGFKYSNMGKYAEAVKMFDKVLELDPAEPLGYNNRGYAKMMMGDHKGALKDINKSLELYPGNSYAYRNRALLYIKMGKESNACEDISAALQRGFTDMYGDEMLVLKTKYCKQ